MKFRTWLSKVEEGIQRGRSMGNVDQTTGLGPTAHFGGQRAMLPVSWGVDNRAFAGLIGGVGEARAKIRARKGAEPGVASQYSWLDDMRRDGMQTAYMPLQLPTEDEWGGQPISISKGLITQMRYSFGDALENPRLWRVDEEMRLIEPSGRPATDLYIKSRLRAERPSRLEAAINYTTALMQASFMVKLSHYSHLLNLEKPILHHQPIMAFPMKERPDGKPYEENEDVDFYKVMMCSFVFKPKSKEIDIDDDMHKEIERSLSAKDEETPPPPNRRAKNVKPKPNP